MGGRHVWGWSRIRRDGPRAGRQLRPLAHSCALIRCALSLQLATIFCNDKSITTREVAAFAAHNTNYNVRAIGRRLLLLELLRPHGTARRVLLGCGALARRARSGLPLPGTVRSGRHAARRYPKLHTGQFGSFMPE